MSTYKTDDIQTRSVDYWCQFPGYGIVTIIMEDVTFGGNWVKYIHDPSVMFLTVACESTIISKYKFLNNKEKIL